MLSAAVIGVGSMGKNHARVYNEIDIVKLVAVSDINKKNKKIADKYNCKFYDNYKEMLEKEKIDLVSVAVPTKLHREIALHVINKGIDILIEKPITSTVEEAQEIIEKAKEKNIKLMVGHVERFNPSIIELKKRINQLGKIFNIAIRRIGPYPNRIRDVGVIVDLATHDLDIMCYLNKAKIKRLYAETEQKIHTDYEDLFYGLLKFENNVLATLNVNWLTPTKIREITVTGERGMFVADTIKQELFFFENKLFKNNYEYNELVSGVLEGDMVKININQKEPLLAELEAFISCILHNKAPPVTGEDGLNALKLALLMKESANKNKVISL